jgi:hypothetical protein
MDVLIVTLLFADVFFLFGKSDLNIQSGCSGAISSEKTQKCLVCDARFSYFCVSSLIMCKLTNCCCYRIHTAMVLSKHIQRISKTLIWDPYCNGRLSIATGAVKKANIIYAARQQI